MKVRWLYVILFALVICTVVYLSLPTRETLLEMSRDDGDPVRTEELLRRQLRRNPANLAVALELADIYEKDGKDDEVLSLLADAFQRHHDNPVVRKRYSTALLRQDRIDEAFAVLPKKERDREFYLGAVGHYIARGDLRRAEEMLIAAEMGKPPPAAVWRAIAGWRRDLYNLDGEAEALRKALALDADDADTWEAYFRNSAWRIHPGDVMEAAAGLESLAPLDRTHLETVYEMSLARRDTAGAALAMEKMSKLPDSVANDRVELARLLYRRGERERADREMLALLTEKDAPADAVADAVNMLGDSATRATDLDLAFKTVQFAATPEAVQSSLATAVDLAIEMDRLDAIEPYLQPLLEDESASADVLALGYQFAYRAGKYDAMPGLLERLLAAGGSVDDVLYTVLDSPNTREDWRRETAARPKSVSAWAGLARAAVLAGDGREVEQAVQTALPLLDMRDAPDGFALFEAMLFLSRAQSLSESARGAWLDRALALGDTLAEGPLGHSRWFMLMAADANDRAGRAHIAEQYWKQVASTHPDDTWSWMGIGRASAARGDVKVVEAIIRQFEEGGGRRDAAEIRGLMYVCLALVDFYRDEDPALSTAWLDKTGALLDRYASDLEDGDVENMRLFATMDERAERWEAASGHWRAVAAIQPDDAGAWLGLARSSIALGRPDAAWNALERARASGAADASESALQLAWQYLAAADATPESDPRRRERRLTAERYAGQLMAGGWHADLAASLVWRAIDAGDLDKASAILSQAENAPPELHAAMAEGLLNRKLTDQARAEAFLASRSDDRDVLLRVAYVFSQTAEKERARALLERVRSMPGRETPAYLLDLADTFGAVDDFDTQFALTERRARMGGEREWLDAVDRRVWAGDYAGAQKVADEAERIHPESVSLLERRLEILADNNQPGRVIRAYVQAVQRIADVESRLSAEGLSALGVAYDDTRSTPTARRYFRLALAKEPANKRGSMGYARLQRRDGNLGGAIRQLRVYVGEHADDAWGWLELANTRNEADQNGRPEYRKVLELTEPDTKGEIARDVRAARAVALRQLGREKEALALMRSTMGPVVDNPDIACDYAEMLMEVRRYDEAEKILRETVRVFPKHVWAYRLEATILVRRKRYDLAVDRLKEALRAAPGDGEAERDLGFAAQMWERTWKAQKGWLQAGGR